MATAVAGLLLGACVSGPAAPPPRPAWVGPVDLIGELQELAVRDEDTLIDLARTHDLGFLELVSANPGVDPWVPGERDILLPTAYLLPAGDREGIVVNLPAMRLFVFRAGERPRTFPIGVSRDGWRTPLGQTKIVRKKKDPTWYPGPSARKDYAELGPVVGPGPENPLGTHALYLGWPAILIHGTNEPYGIGRRVSRGCIRLYPEDIVQLFELAEKGMPVRVVNEPILVGWYDGELYLEAHLTMDQATDFEERSSFEPVSMPEGLRDQILAKAGDEAARIDWDRVEGALAERTGVPVQITEARPEKPRIPTVLQALRRWVEGTDTPERRPALARSRARSAPEPTGEASDSRSVGDDASGGRGASTVQGSRERDSASDAARRDDDLAPAGS